jgi:hypothetical protein
MQRCLRCPSHVGAHAQQMAPSTSSKEVPKPPPLRGLVAPWVGNSKVEGRPQTRPCRNSYATIHTAASIHVFLDMEASQNQLKGQLGHWTPKPDAWHHQEWVGPSRGQFGSVLGEKRPFPCMPLSAGVPSGPGGERVNHVLSSQKQ